MCIHLKTLETELKQEGIKEVLRGKVWSENCREWVYFDCYLDIESIRVRLNLPEFVVYHQNEDAVSGTEEGLVCTLCLDAILGYHRRLDQLGNKVTFH